MVTIINAADGGDRLRFLLLDGLRGVAALSVVVYHITESTAQPLMKMAPVAVDLFFCISGFVIAFSYERKMGSVREFVVFMRMRLIRLYPMFIFGLIIGTFALLYRISEIGLVTTAFFLNSFYIPFFNSEELEGAGKSAYGVLFPANPPSWSLFFEMCMYIAFVTIAKIKTRAMVCIVAISLALYSGLVLYFGHGLGWSTAGFVGGFPRVAYGFISGIIIYRVFRKIENNRSIDDNGIFRSLKTFCRRHPSATSMLVMTFLIACMCIDVRQTRLITIILLPLVPIIVFISAFVQLGALMKYIFGFLGWLSYPLYCIHYPILCLLDSYIYVEVGQELSLSIVLIVIFIIVISAIIVGKMFDDPLRAYLRSKCR